MLVQKKFFFKAEIDIESTDLSTFINEGSIMEQKCATGHKKCLSKLSSNPLLSALLLELCIATRQNYSHCDALSTRAADSS